MRRTRPVLAYLVTEDWYFVSHRLPMARAARDAGFEVHVLTNVAAHGPAIEADGFIVHPLPWKRGSLNPLDLWTIIRAVRRVYRALSPDLVHHVALQPAIIGSLAAFGMPFARLNALAGLGFAFTSRTLKARFIGAALSFLLRMLLKGARAMVLVQNPDDSAAVLNMGISEAKVALIPGSGVDTDHLQPLPEPAGPVTAAFVGRLLDDKGVRPLVAAERLLRERGTPVRLLLAGEADPANPASIPPQEIASWKGNGIGVLGQVSDIRQVWREAHIAVLPSRREGLPKSLLEAAACGRPIVATDVPGCREIAREGVNALLVPPDDPAALAEAIGRLAADPALRARFGAAGRALAENEFSARKIGGEIVALYRRLLADGRA
jgi:glycosyltransferase involved in cell wall biosynthesis